MSAGEGEVETPVLSARDLVGCEHRLALDFANRDSAGGGPVDADVARRTEAATAHRGRVRELLRGLHSGRPGTFVIIEPGAAAERVAATQRACDAGADWIWNATLPTDRIRGRRGHAEVLVRVDGGYLPVIVVNHRVSYPAKARRNGDVSTSSGNSSLHSSPLWGWLPSRDPNRTGRSHRRDQLRLAQLTQMLIDLRLAPDIAESELRAGVIGLDADCIVVHPMGPLLTDYRDVFPQRAQVAAGSVATMPRRIGECRGCRWWGRCEPELIERHDISLVAMGNQGAILIDAGLRTVDELAHYTGPPPDRWPPNVAFDDVVVGAAAWLTGVPLVRRSAQPKVRRADVEVDVDMESFGEDGAYLWGTLLTDRRDTDRPVLYRPFVTWQPLPTIDEARSFAEFWTWLMDERAQAHAAGKSFAAYCYSQQAENRWLLGSADRFAGAPGMPTRAEVEDFIASPEWVDIYEAVNRNFICPNGKGLKRIAPVAGFSWRDSEAGGAASMDWYRDAVGLRAATLDLTQRQRLLEYNEDDVVATKVLREWMDGPAVHAMPLAADLLESRNSGSSESGPSESVSSESGGSTPTRSGASGPQRVEERPAPDERDSAE